MNDIIPLITDLKIKWHKLQSTIQKMNADACIITSNVNIYYLCGQIFSGYIYFPSEGDPLFFVKKSQELNPDFQTVFIRKPEDITEILKSKGIHHTNHILLEGDQISFNEYTRLQAVFNPDKTSNASDILRKLRMIKTPWEIEQFRYSAKKHAEVYAQIPFCYKEGITDLEFQANIELIMRNNGSIGIFRGFGSNMDIYMGSILSGENAGSISPFDFALGGEGTHPSLPVGANKTKLKPGTSVMVDMAGNYTAYITDMTRVFSIGKLPDEVYRAHQLSIDIQNRMIDEFKTGLSCADIYNFSLEMSEKAGFAKNFMGTRQQAKFVGHGVGIEINELPVLTARSKDALEPGMVFALEPKFVFPGVGAVGIENTFLVKDRELEKLTLFNEEIIELGVASDALLC